MTPKQAARGTHLQLRHLAAQLLLHHGVRRRQLVGAALRFGRLCRCRLCCRPGLSQLAAQISTCLLQLLPPLCQPLALSTRGCQLLPQARQRLSLCRFGLCRLELLLRVSQLPLQLCTLCCLSLSTTAGLPQLLLQLRNMGCRKAPRSGTCICTQVQGSGPEVAANQAQA